MLKNYLIINTVLGVLLVLVVFGVVRTMTTSVDGALDIPTPPPLGPSPTPVPGAAEDDMAQNANSEAFNIIYEANLTHPQRIVPATPTPVRQDQPTATPLQVDCSQSQLTLSGIVMIENEKPFCFLSHPKDTENEVTMFTIDQKIGPYKITAIQEDSIKLTADDGSICELLLFDFNDKSAAAPQGKPTPPSRRRSFQRPTPRPRQFQPSE